MTTSVICTPDFLEIANGASVVIDTCVIIDALKIAELDKLLRLLLESGCTFLSAHPVKNEFLAAADSSDEYDRLDEYLESLRLVFLPLDIEHRLNKEGKDFNIALRKSHIHKPSFVDRLILSVPFLYRQSPEKIYVMTSNHKDVPSQDFYDRVGFVSVDDRDRFVQIGLYEFNEEKFDKMLEHIKRPTKTAPKSGI